MTAEPRPALTELDLSFSCPSGTYAIGDPDHASPVSSAPLTGLPGIVDVFGALVVELATPGEVSLRVRRLNRDQWADGSPPVPLTGQAVSKEKVEVLPQGPMEVFTGARSLGSVGGAAGSYVGRWYCLSRDGGREEHLLGLCELPEGTEESSTSDEESPLALLAETLSASGTPLIRADFSDDSAWTRVIEAVTKPTEFEGSPYGPYQPNVRAFDDPQFAGVTGEALGEMWASHEAVRGYVVLADARSTEEAAAGDEITVVYVDLSVKDDDAELFNSFLGRTFRCATAEFASVESNLAIANMDFHEFADNVQHDGVFRGFDSGQ
jgi:hypothetical protein